MTTLKLFGSVTSPYVRRVRIVALELGVPVSWTDTTTEEGQVELRAFNPLWKVPAAELDGVALFDSSLIGQELIRRFGTGAWLSEESRDVTTQNWLRVVDGALDALINAFYLFKDGVSPEQSAYVQKQRERAAAALAWLERQESTSAWLAEEERFGWTEIVLLSALDWMRFRQVYEVERHPQLWALAQKQAHRASVSATFPDVPWSVQRA